MRFGRNNIRRSAILVSGLVAFMVMVQAYSQIERHQALIGLEELLLTIEDLLDDRRTIGELDPRLSPRYDEKIDDIQTALEIGDFEGAVEAANWLGSYSIQPYVGGETTLHMYRMWLAAYGIRTTMINPLLSVSTTPPAIRSALMEVEALLLEVENASKQGAPSDIDFSYCAGQMLQAIDLVQVYTIAGLFPASFERRFTPWAETAVRDSCLSISSEVTDQDKFGDLVFMSASDIAEVDAWIDAGISLAEAGDPVGAVENYLYAFILIEGQLDVVRSPLPAEFRQDLTHHVLAFEAELMEAAEEWWPDEHTPTIITATTQLVEVVQAKDVLNGLVIDLASFDPALADAVADANEQAKELAFNERGDDIASVYTDVQTLISRHRTLPPLLKGQLLNSLDAYAAALVDASNTLQTLIAANGDQGCTGEVDPGPGNPDVGLFGNACCNTMGNPHGACIGMEGKTCYMEILNIDPPSGEAGCAYAANTYDYPS